MIMFRFSHTPMAPETGIKIKKFGKMKFSNQRGVHGKTRIYFGRKLMLTFFAIVAGVQQVACTVVSLIPGLSGLDATLR